MLVSLVVAGSSFLASLTAGPAPAPALDFSGALVVVAGGREAELAASVFLEEVEKRTGLHLEVAHEAPRGKPALVVRTGVEALAPEGFRVRESREAGGAPVVCVEARTLRGALYGVGFVLRHMDWGRGRLAVPAGLDVASEPRYPLRGHQLGYRHTANSYDAWRPEQYDQYIRELVLFGCNAVENIPFQDESSPVMPVSRDDMNRAMSRICAKYDIEYWLWTPAEFDLGDRTRRETELDRHETLYRDLARLDGVFFPAGDPGDNPPERVMPFLEELAGRLAAHHPRAGVWFSLQGFEPSELETVYAYLAEQQPKWLRGVIGGPQAPPMHDIRRRVPRQYQVRHYPDITHTVLCEYPVPWWDPAFALTLGREPVNPRPRFYAHVHNWFAPSTDGFITYSDGVHDDVNKIIWTRLGWDPAADPRDILVEYCRFFFRPDLAERAADALLALESNWDGPLAQNGGVDATWAAWRQLEKEAPELMEQWRWRLHAFRALYDYFTRHRLLYETALETEANRILAHARTRGAEAVMDAASAVLGRAETEPFGPELRAALEAHGEALFQQIGLQTSVGRYHARNFERGAVLDFLDRPLNNRWWLEDEFGRIRGLASEEERVQRQELIAHWEDPGPGSFYDDVGNVAKSSHVARDGADGVDPELVSTPVPSYGTWMDGGRSRWRISWLTSMDWPARMVYEGLDRDADYLLRATGRGDAFPRVNGERLGPSAYGKTPGEFKEFAIPRRLTAEGRAVVTWDAPQETGVNWRQASMLTEVWLVRADGAPPRP